MAARWEQVRQEWRQNRRFRLGLLVVLLVLGLQMVLMLSDRQQVLADDYEREAALLDRLAEASRESAWPERADQAEATLAAARDSVPQVSSAGLAQAELQAWLSGQAASGGLQDARVRAESTLDVPGQAELWQVIARLDAVVPPGRLEGFLRALSTGLPWIQAERLEVTEGRDTRLGLIVRAYYRKPAAPGAAGAASAPNAPAADGVTR